MPELPKLQAQTNAAIKPHEPFLARLSLMVPTTKGTQLSTQKNMVWGQSGSMHPSPIPITLMVSQALPLSAKVEVSPEYH